ncbi:hypothetical protein ACHAW6_010120 [Cyclotella cf. meneghiniana]
MRWCFSAGNKSNPASI